MADDGAVWEAAAARAVILGMGPEPDPIPREIEPPGGNEPDEFDSPVPHKPPKKSEPLPPAASKVLVTFLACVVFLSIYIVSFLAMNPGGLGGCTGNAATIIKTGAILGAMDTSKSPCTMAYERACGNYDKRYIVSSVFQETQLAILSDSMAHRNASWRSISETIKNARASETPDDAALSAMGFYGCVDVDVDADVERRTVPALYVSAPCWGGGCRTSRRPYGPVPILRNAPPQFPPLLRTTLEEVMATGASVYWLPPNASFPTAESWECTVTAAEQWHHYLNGTSSFGLVDRLYAIDMPISEGFQTPNVAKLVGTVRKLMLDYIRVASFVATSTAKAAYSERIMTVPILLGTGTNALSARCIVGTPLQGCLTARWSSQIDAVVSKTQISPSTMWSSSPLEVNAYYSPLVDAIYIPYGIMQPPFYSDRWPLWMQMASLGAVIAHEMGHAIRPIWSFPLEMAPEDTAAVNRFENCLVRDFEISGVSETRASITLSENWADAIGVRTLLRLIRSMSQQTTVDGLTLWMQTWCAAGNPHYDPVSTDPHSTPYLRVNGTMSSLATYYHVMGCPLDPARIC